MKVLIPKAIAVLILSLLAINGNTLLAVAQRPYTARDILDRIEANGGPEELDLSGMDLRGIDLSRETIQAELEQEKEDDQRAKPKWVSDLTDGINLRGINLRRATLGEANLQYAYLGEANLQYADLGGANLQHADLWRANLQGAYLVVADLQHVDLGKADFQDADLREANLQQAKLRLANLERADLWEANLEGVDLWGANLQYADLEEANLTRVNLLDTQSIEGISLYRATLERTQLTKDQLRGAIGEELRGEYFKAKETYLALKNNFAQIGRYDDAAWAYVKERKMERATLWPFRSAQYYAGGWWREANWWQRGRFYSIYFGKWAWAGLIDAVTGYGQQVSNVLGMSAFIIVLWSALYWLLGGIGDRHKPRSFCWRDFQRCLKHSVATFANLTYSSLEPKTLVAQWLTNAEALLGIGMLALLMFVIGNRIGGI